MSSSGAISTSGLAYAAAVVDGVTDNSAYFNQLALNGSPSQLFRAGIIVCKSPIILQRRTLYTGLGAEGGLHGGTTIQFDNTRIMPGGNSATVTANGTTWVFSNFGGVGAPHGLVAGNTFGTSGYATLGFNSGDLVANVAVPFAFLATAATTTTTITIANTTIPAGSDSGFVNVHLVRFGVPGGNVTPSTLLSQLLIECNDIPGSSGLYTNDAQELTGIDGVNIENYRWRGYMIDGTGTVPFAPSKFPLNHYVNNLRVVSSALCTAPELAALVGYDEYGGNVSNGRINGITAVNGSSIQSAKQVRFNKCNGLRTNIHVEDADDGITIGDIWGCTALKIDGYTGTSGVGNALRIRNNAAHPNTQISIEGGYADGATNVYVDDFNAITGTTFSGKLITDKNGAILLRTDAPAKVIQALGTTQTLTNSAVETVLWTGATIPAAALAVGQVYRLRYGGTFDAIATSGIFSDFIKANTVKIQGSNQMAASQTGIGTALPYYGQFDITITATGAGGSIRVSGIRNTTTAAGAASLQINAAAAPDVAVDLSAGLTFSKAFAMATNNAGNTIRLDTLALTQIA